MNTFPGRQSFKKASEQTFAMDAEDEDDHLGRSTRGGDLPLLDAAPAGVPSAEGKGGEQERYRESMSEMYVRHNLRVHCSPVCPSRPSNAHTSYVPHALDVFGPHSRFAHSTALPCVPSRLLAPFLAGSSRVVRTARTRPCGSCWRQSSSPTPWRGALFIPSMDARS